MPELIVSQNNQVFFRVPLTTGGLTIGRSGDCDVTLTGDEISRLHAEIRWVEGVYKFYNRGQGGTKMGDKEVSETLLQNGGEISIGGYQLKFVEKSGAEEGRAREVETSITRIKGIGQTRILRLDPKGEKFVVENPFLIVADPTGKQKRYSLNKTSTQLGSSDVSDVVIHDEYVSGKHCRIIKRGEALVLVDDGSTNGTFLNGQKVGEAPLVPPAEIVLGQTKISIQIEEGEEEITAYPAQNFCGLVGKSEAMRTLFSKIERVAPSRHTVLIAGETGTGKEMVARSIHDLSAGRAGPYVILNCGAISANLIESELFGHEKGAFTGAVGRRIGAFEQAQGGTLFLDEIGELPLELQPKLLRVLENQTLRRVGGDSEVSVDVRVVAATHRQLSDEVKKGKFREDLYFRLYVIPLWVPPLRERKGDIALLANHFIIVASMTGAKTFSDAALTKLKEHRWPGNVRELKNVVLRSLIFCDGPEILPENIEMIGGDFAGTGVEVNLMLIEKEKIEEALQKTDRNKTRAAQLLGIAKSTLFKKLKEYGIPF